MTDECWGSPAVPGEDDAAMELFTMRDLLFTDPIAMQWMETATADATEWDISTTVSNEMSPDHVDDDMLGEFLWDALDCH